MKEDMLGTDDASVAITSQPIISFSCDDDVQYLSLNQTKFKSHENHLSYNMFVKIIDHHWPHSF